MSNFIDYHVWWRKAHEMNWKQTTHNLRARTDKEAEKKLRRTFSGAGFSYMSMVAIKSGDNPNNN